MKTVKENTEQQINLTMQSIEGIERAKANPFLYEKVMARINNTDASTDTNKELNFGLNIKYALALAVFIILNIVTITQFSGEAPKTQTETQEDSKTKFVNEYFNSSNSYGY